MAYKIFSLFHSKIDNNYQQFAGKLPQVYNHPSNCCMKTVAYKDHDGEAVEEAVEEEALYCPHGSLRPTPGTLPKGLRLGPAFILGLVTGILIASLIISIRMTNACYEVLHQLDLPKHGQYLFKFYHHDNVQVEHTGFQHHHTIQTHLNNSRPLFPHILQIKSCFYRPIPSLKGCNKYTV